MKGLATELLLGLGIGQPEGKVLQIPYSVEQVRVKPGKQPQAEQLVLQLILHTILHPYQFLERFDGGSPRPTHRNDLCCVCADTGKQRARGSGPASRSVNKTSFPSGNVLGVSSSFPLLCNLHRVQFDCVP